MFDIIPSTMIDSATILVNLLRSFQSILKVNAILDETLRVEVSVNRSLRTADLKELAGEHHKG